MLLKNADSTNSRPPLWKIVIKGRDTKKKKKKKKKKKTEEEEREDKEEGQREREEEDCILIIDAIFVSSVAPRVLTRTNGPPNLFFFEGIFSYLF